MIGDPCLALLARCIPGLDQILGQVHYFFAEGRRPVFPFRIIRQIRPHMFQRAAATGAVADDDIDIFELPDVFFGQFPEIRTHGMGQMRQPATDIVARHRFGDPPHNFQRLLSRLRKQDLHAAALEIGHFAVFGHFCAGRRRRRPQRGRSGKSRQEMRPGIFIRSGAERRQRIQSQFAGHRQPDGPHFDHPGPGHHPADEAVLQCGAAGIVGKILPNQDHRFIGLDLGRTVFDATLAKDAEIQRGPDFGSRFQSTIRHGPENRVLAAGCGRLDVAAAEQGAYCEAVTAAVALGDKFAGRRQFFLRFIHTEIPPLPNLAGIQDSFGIERLLDGFQRGHAGFAQRLVDIRLLGDADAVFAG